MPWALTFSLYSRIHLDLLKFHHSNKCLVPFKYVNGFLSGPHAKHKSHQACALFTCGVSRLQSQELVMILGKVLECHLKYK